MYPRPRIGLVSLSASLWVLAYAAFMDGTGSAYPRADACSASSVNCLPDDTSPDRVPHSPFEAGIRRAVVQRSAAAHIDVHRFSAAIAADIVAARQPFLSSITHDLTVTAITFPILLQTLPLRI